MKKIEEVPTTDRYINAVINRVACGVHDAARTEPCWYWSSIKQERVIFAVCNSRAKNAGMNAPIKPSSLRKKDPVLI